MNTPNALFIGLNTIDTQFLVPYYPHENQKAKATDFGLYAGGPATNAAVSFAHLGGKSHLLSAFGTHPLTHLVYDDIRKYGVQTTDLTPKSTEAPIFASIITTQGSGHRAIVSYHPVSPNYCYNTLDSFSLEDFDIILCDSFFIEAALKVLAKNDKKIPVVLDGGSWKQGLEKLLPYIDIAICSADFFPPETSKTEEVFDYLKQFNITQIAITRGAKPILVHESGQDFELEVPTYPVCDSLGAGDIFHGAFCYYYAQNKDFTLSLQEASKVAGKSCGVFGTRKWME